MNEKQLTLCGKHNDLLTVVWKLGWGLALQPQLVELMVSLHAYPSEQMCRRGIRELKEAQLVKAKHWLDGKSEILILCKPAIAYIMNCSSAEITSIPTYTSREPDRKSVFRLWYAQDLVGRMELVSYTALTEAINNSYLSLYFHLTDLSDYWKAHEAFFPSGRDYQYELNALDYWKRPFQLPVEKQPKDITTLHTLHQHGIFLIGRIKNNRPSYPCALRFGYFNQHDLAAKKAVQLACMCQEWTRGLYRNYDVQLVIFCKSETQADSLSRQLLKSSRGDYRQFWQTESNRRLDDYQACPIRMVDTGIQERYLKAIPM